MLFSMDFQVSYRRRDGGVVRYTLLENQGGYLVVIVPSQVPALRALMRSAHVYDLDLLVWLADHVLVLDRLSGDLVPSSRATDILSASRQAVLRACAVYRTPLEARWRDLSGADLAWSFALVCAQRGFARVSCQDHD